jgi:hypothetical protein
MTDIQPSRGHQTGTTPHNVAWATGAAPYCAVGALHNEIEGRRGRGRNKGRDARRLREVAAELPTTEDAHRIYPVEAPTIVELVERDPPSGLARLRMDLEQQLRRLWDEAIKTARLSSWGKDSAF